MDKSANNQQPQAAHRPFQVEGDTMEGELRPPRCESAPMEVLEPLTFTQFGETGLDDHLTPPISGTGQRMLQQLRHPFSEFLASIAFERAATRRIGAAAAQRTITALA